MPLSTLLRPKNLKEFIGQERLLGENGPLRKIIESKKIPSMIFLGPPASGKTTLALIIANTVDADFNTLSAVNSGKADLRKIIAKSKENKNLGKETILFIDEIHRWNKAQQDALLPSVENGEIILIGATTENPSFTVINALLSRSRVFIFDAHKPEHVSFAIDKAMVILKQKSIKFEIDEKAKEFLSDISHGDIRFALNSLELAFNLHPSKIINKPDLENIVQKVIQYDKNGEEHYNLISAVHKSLRSSNASAACYWISRMLIGGEDPLYIARRLIRFASEDIGNANPNALLLANVVYDTCHKIGMPECEVVLIQLAKYLADSKKDNSAYTASQMAKNDAEKFGELPVPLHLRNAPTQLMKDLDYGKGYEYDHDLENKKSDQECFPDKLKSRKYFEEK